MTTVTITPRCPELRPVAWFPGGQTTSLVSQQPQQQIQIIQNDRHEFEFFHGQQISRKGISDTELDPLEVTEHSPDCQPSARCKFCQQSATVAKWRTVLGTQPKGDRHE